MKRQKKGSLLQRAMAILLSAVLVVGMTANAVPMHVFAQENVDEEDKSADAVNSGADATGDPAGNPDTEGEGDSTGNPNGEGTGDSTGNPDGEGTGNSIGNPNGEGTGDSTGNLNGEITEDLTQPPVQNIPGGGAK